MKNEKTETTVTMSIEKYESLLMFEKLFKEKAKTIFFKGGSCGFLERTYYTIEKDNVIAELENMNKELLKEVESKQKAIDFYRSVDCQKTEIFIEKKCLFKWLKSKL